MKSFSDRWGFTFTELLKSTVKPLRFEKIPRAAIEPDDVEYKEVMLSTKQVAELMGHNDLVEMLDKAPLSHD